MLWYQPYQDKFLRILENYPGLITMTLTAHTHMDEYRIMSRAMTADTTPGIAPYFGNNPAYKIFTLSADTLTATDYSSLNYDLATTPAQFTPSYTFSTAYAKQGFLGDSLAALYSELLLDGAKQAMYRNSYFSGHNYTIPPGNTFNPITDLTWPVYWCGIGIMDETNLIKCVNSFR